MDKKQERNLTIGIIALIVLLVGAVALPIILSLPSTYSYTGADGVVYNISVDKHTGKPIHIVSFWTSYRTANNAPQFKKEYIVPFEYGPKELEYISLDDGVDDLIFNKTRTKNIYITRDVKLDVETEGKMAIAILTIQRITDNEMQPAVFKIPTRGAITEESGLTEGLDVPIKTCEDSGRQGSTIVLFKRGEENKIYIDNNECVTLEFVNDDDAIAVATKLVYHLIGIM